MMDASVMKSRSTICSAIFLLVVMEKQQSCKWSQNIGHTKRRSGLTHFVSNTIFNKMHIIINYQVRKYRIDISSRGRFLA